MKDKWNNFKNLVWWEKLIATPAILVLLIFMLLGLPLILVIMSIMYAVDVLELEFFDP